MLKSIPIAIPTPIPSQFLCRAHRYLKYFPGARRGLISYGDHKGGGNAVNVSTQRELPLAGVLPLAKWDILIGTTRRATD